MLHLQVNGIQLMGLNHLDVVTTLKQLPSVVNLTCARYPVPIRIINTAQHREAFEERVSIRIAEDVSSLKFYQFPFNSSKTFHFIYFNG